MTRRLAATLALIALSSPPVHAQENAALWHAPDQWFEAAFPGQPTISRITYTTAGPHGEAVAVPATRYAVNQRGASYQVTVASLAGTPAQVDHVLDHAIAHVRAQRHLALDASTSHSYTGSSAQACGRQFGYQGKDGRLHYQTLFYNERTGLFYEIRSSVARADQAEHGADVAHFQQSFALLADPGATGSPAPPPPADWQTVSNATFTLRFPATPTVTQGEYRTATGIAVPDTVYEARQGSTLYRLTAVHLWQTDGDDPAVLDREIARWQRRGEVVKDAAVAIPAAQCGRDITLRDTDGATVHSTLFFPSSQHRLYIIEVRHAAPPEPQDALDDRRFRDSFTVAKPE